MHHISKLKTDIEKFGSEKNQEMAFPFSVFNAQSENRSKASQKPQPCTMHTLD
jgi:hypothetical protein